MKPSEKQTGVAAPVDCIVRDENVAEKLNEYISVEDRLKRVERWIEREEQWHDRLDALSDNREAESTDTEARFQTCDDSSAAVTVLPPRRLDVSELLLCSTHREFLDRFGGVDMDARQLQSERMIQSDCIINDLREIMGLKRLPGGDVPISQMPSDFGQI